MRANQFTPNAVERHKRNRYIRRLHQMTGWDTSHLELLSNDELRDLHIQHQQERDSKPTDEAMSAGVRMQRALQREKEKRERGERYAEKHFPIGKPKEEPKKDQGVAEGMCEVCGTSLAEHGKASLKLCKSSRPDSELGASNLASCKSQGLRARDGDKSHKLGKGPESRVKVGGHKIKGKKYGGPLPDWS
jgi:hypothetical protein